MARPPDRSVDAIGLLCPLPVLKARKVLASMTAGQVLRIETSDAQAESHVFLIERG